MIIIDNINDPLKDLFDTTYGHASLNLPIYRPICGYSNSASNFDYQYEYSAS